MDHGVDLIFEYECSRLIIEDQTCHGVIIAKGQGNYETLHDCGLNIYYLFLCKCKWFQYQFNAKPLQGMFINERRI